MTRSKLARTVPAMLIAGAVKAWYSGADANGLLWLLAPTSWIAGLLTGESFHYEDYMGYVNADYSFLIAVPCAGVNFLITAFLLVALVRIWSDGRRGSLFRIVAFAAAAAYLATVVANSLRIAVALVILRLQPEITWITPDQVHRLEGIFIYFGCLVLLFACCRPAPQARFGSGRTAAIWLALPLLVYWAVALGVPFINGAYAQGRPFWEHAIFVLLTPSILILPSALYCYVASRRRSHAF